MATQYDFNPFSPQRESSPTRSSFPFLSGPVPGVQEGTKQSALPGDMAMQALMAMMPQLLQAQTQAKTAGLPAQMTQAGPALWERSFGPGGGFSPTTRARQITGGFAPGTVGATFEKMLPKILASLMGGAEGMGGPSRADLLDPRLADLERTFGKSERGILNRFASLGRDVTGSVPTEALGELGARKGFERQRAMGDVDTLLANLGIQQQSAASQRLAVIMQIMAALGMGGR